jgi:hypothetical protein
MNVLSFEAFASLEVINSIELWEDLFKGYLLGLGEKMFLFKSQEIPARPLWACIYTTQSKGQCKGHVCV